MMDSMDMNQLTQLNQLTDLPLVALNDVNDDATFDYVPYLQGGSTSSYLHGEVSSTSISSFNDPIVAAGSSTPIIPSRATENNNLSHKQKLERRGHLKSRRGCFNCKRRRIKVQEPRKMATEDSTRANYTISVKKHGPRAATA